MRAAPEKTLGERRTVASVGSSVEVARWAAWNWPVFVVGNRAGIFDPNQNATSMLVREPDGKRFSCALTGSAGRTLVTRNTFGNVIVWRDDKPIASFTSPLLAHGKATVRPCSTEFLLESSIQARFDHDDARVLVLVSDEHSCGRELRLFEVGKPEQAIPLPSECITTAEFTPNPARLQFLYAHTRESFVRGTFVYDTDLRRVVLKTLDGVLWSSDGVRLVTDVAWSDDPKTTVYDADGNELRSFPNLLLSSFSPSGRYILGGKWEKRASEHGSERWKAIVVDVETGASQASWRSSDSGCGRAAAWDSKDRLVSAEGARFVTWSRGSTARMSKEECEDGFTTQRLASDEKRIVSYNGIFDFVTGKRLVTLQSDAGRLEVNDWSKDDAFIHGQDRQGHVVWHAATGKVASSLPKQKVLDLGAALWASERSLLWLAPAKDDSPWIGLHDPATGRTLRVAVGLVNDEFGLVVMDEGECFQGPSELAQRLMPDFPRRRSCTTLLRSDASDRAR